MPYDTDRNGPISRESARYLMLRYAERHQPKTQRAVSKRYGDGWGEKAVQPGFELEFPLPVSTTIVPDIDLPVAPDSPSVSVSESESASESVSESESASESASEAVSESEEGSVSDSESASESGSTSDSASASDDGGGGGGDECCFYALATDRATYDPLGQFDECLAAVDCCGGHTFRFDWTATASCQIEIAGDSYTVDFTLTYAEEYTCDEDSTPADWYNGQGYTITPITDNITIHVQGTIGGVSVDESYNDIFDQGAFDGSETDHAVHNYLTAMHLFAWLSPSLAVYRIESVLESFFAVRGIFQSFGTGVTNGWLPACPGGNFDFFRTCYACGEDCQPCVDSRNNDGVDGAIFDNYDWNGGASCETGGYAEFNIRYLASNPAARLGEGDITIAFESAWGVTRVDDSCCIENPGNIAGAQECCTSLAASSYCDGTAYSVCSANCAETDEDGQPLCCCKRIPSPTSPGVYVYACRYCSDA